MKKYPKIGIVYLSFHCEPYIDDVVSSLKKLTYPKDRLEFIVVDNPHPKYGDSVKMLNDLLLPLSGKEIPNVTILPQTENTGFAKGMNIGGDWAIEHGCDYITYHNADGFFAANALEPLIETAEQEGVGIVQSLIALHPDTHLVNTDGNSFHFLGFGYCDKYKEKISSIDTNVRDIAYASGAAFLISAKLIKTYGGWDEDFFLYHEDLEWSLRLKFAGYRVVIEPRSIFFHKYQFKRSITKFYWMERNRFGVLLMFYRWSTLLLILPMLIVMEAGLWLFALKGGWVKERIAVWKYWLKPSSWKLWLGKRKNVQALRTISDRDVLVTTSPKIIFQEASMKNPILKYIGNPMMMLYYKFLLFVVRW